MQGNSRSRWYAERGCEAIAEKLFDTLALDRFLLEYDDARSGSFEPLRPVPRDKTVVLGLVSSKRPLREDIVAIVQRIHETAKYVPLENLALSPHCGFVSTTGWNLLTEEEQWAIVGLMAETVSRVWG